MADVKLYPTDSTEYKINISSGATGPKGDIGVTPNLTVDNTITGAPYTNANVSISGTAENPALTFTIPQGNPFVIAAEYPTITDLENNTNPTPSGYTPSNFDFAIITSATGVEDEDNAKLYIYDQGPIGGWTFVSDLSGATGPRRELRWKPDGEGGITSTLQWRNDDGTWDEANERDLGLTFSFSVVEGVLRLNISNSNGLVGWTDLTAIAEFGDGIEETVTSVRFVNNNATATNYQELGVYASWENTNLKLTNPNGIIEQQELALDYEWDGTTLGIKNPTASVYDTQKLSPDIAFDNSNGVEISVVEPGAAQSFTKISPNIAWDSTKLAVVEPNVTPASEDYVELGVYASWGSTELGTNRTLTIGNPNGTEVSKDLGLEYNWDGTSLGIKIPEEDNFTYVDLKGETGDPYVEGTNLFRIRDDDDLVDNGYQIAFSDEMQIKGSNGVSVKRTNEIFTVSADVIDGGDFVNDN